MAGFLTNLGLAAGRNIITGQELQEKQEDIDLKKQQIAMGQIAIANAQRQQQTQQAVGSFLSSEAAKDASNVTDPVKAAGMLERGAQVALQGGDFVTANTMGELAKGKLQEAKEQAAAVAQQQQVKKEALANAADDYAANPTPEGYKDLARKAIDAGQKPTEIPMPGTPQFASWLNNQKLASKDASQKADFVQKAYEMDQNRQEKQREYDQTQKRILQEHRDNVMLREAMIQAKAEKAPSHIETATGIYEYNPDQSIKGTRDLADPAYVKIGASKQGQNASNVSQAVVASSREALRGLRIIGAMDTGQTTGPFTGINDGTLVHQLTNTGTNVLTPEDMQDYNVATKGLGLEISRAMTLGAGRGANQATINEMQDIVTAHAGTPKAVAVFKYANAIDIIRNRLESTGTLPNPEQEAMRQEALKQMQKVPLPEDVLKATKDAKLRRQMLTTGGSMADTAEKMQVESQSGGVGLPGSGTGNAPADLPPLPAGGGLPPGVTVRIH